MTMRARKGGKLARTHWGWRPRKLWSEKREEDRMIVRLRGGIVVERKVERVTVWERWRDGECKDVVLDVETKRRISTPCPDCVPPMKEEP
jgi:hypothetical protein